MASALMARIGVAPADRHKAKLECLRLLGEALLDFGTLDDLTDWFEQYARMEGTS